MDNCLNAPLGKWACYSVIWLQHHFTNDQISNVLMVILGLIVLSILFGYWWIKSAFDLWVLNTFLERTGKGKMPHTFRTYLSLSVIKRELHQTLVR